MPANVADESGRDRHRRIERRRLAERRPAGRRWRQALRHARREDELCRVPGYPRAEEMINDGASPLVPANLARTRPL